MVCFECESKAHHAHHVVPRVLGGTKTISLCSVCHAKIHGDHLLRTSELTKAGMKKARDAGFYVSGRAPFGTEVVNGKLIRNEREQNIIQEMILMQNAGLSLLKIKNFISENYKIVISISSIRRAIRRSENAKITE